MKKIILILLALFNLSHAFALDWSEARDVVNNGIKENILPGAVLLIGKKNEILFHEAFGSIDGNSNTNSTDTLYDIASLTKIATTTTSIMLLEERGKISLQDKLGKYFPNLEDRQKKNITIEQILRHEAGFAAWQSQLPNETFENFFERFLKVPLTYKPGTKFVYSDLGFILLARIVQKITGQTIEKFAVNNIFKPLNMTSTFYHVPEDLSYLCAPTMTDRKRCAPHDPISFRFSPLELGHAGLFTTAENLSHLIQMYANFGKYNNIRFLKEETVKKMIMVPSGKLRGLGFDLLSPYADAPRGQYFPKGISYGHTGYTGTTIWIDPTTGSFLIFLSNRVYLGDETTLKRFGTFRNEISSAIGKQFYP